MATLVPGSFSVDHLGIYLGLTDANETEADGCCPFFTFDVAMRVAMRIAADWINFEGVPGEPPAQALYDAEADAFLLFEPATREWHELEGEPFGPNVLYAMGRDLWTWQRTKDK